MVKEFNVTGYVTGVSAKGVKWLKLCGTLPVSTSDKVAGSGYDVASVLVSGDKVDEAFKSVDGHFLGAKVKMFVMFNKGSEFSEFMEISPKGGK